jgi:hypothetical protein
MKKLFRLTIGKKVFLLTAALTVALIAVSVTITSVIFSKKKAKRGGDAMPYLRGDPRGIHVGI